MSHAAMACMPLVVSSRGLAASRVRLVRQTAMTILRRHALSVCPASTQRRVTVVTASAVRVVASHRQLVAHRWVRARCVRRVSTAPRGHRRVRSAHLVELMRTWMPRLSVPSAASAHMPGVGRRHVTSVLLVRSTVMRTLRRHAHHAWRVSTGKRGVETRSARASSARPGVRTWTVIAQLRATTVVSASTLPLDCRHARAA